MTMNVRARALTGIALPRAIRLLGVRAEGASTTELLTQLNNNITTLKAEYKGQLDGLNTIVTEFRAANDAALKTKADVVVTEKVERLNAAIEEGKTLSNKVQAELATWGKAIDDINAKIAASTAGIGQKSSTDPRAAGPHFGAYQKAFNTYFRKGEHAVGGEQALRDLEIKAAMTVGSDPDGGYTVLPEIETTIDEVVKQVSPMRSLASVRTIGTAEYKKLVNLHGTNSGWVGEQQTRPQTLTSQLSELKFPVMEVYAMPAATQSLLDDGFVDIGQWLAGEVQLEFAQKEGTAFIAGDGIMKPSGIIAGYPVVANASYAWGKIGFVGTGNSGAFASTNPADCIVDLYHSINTAYRNTSNFLANRGTLGVMRKLKDGQGNYLMFMVFRPEGFIEEILGRPAVEMPDMPDIAANSLSIAFGDFKRGYLIIDRIGIRVLRDPYSSKPFVLFYTTKRVGGGVQNFEAIKLLKFA